VAAAALVLSAVGAPPPLGIEGGGPKASLEDPVGVGPQIAVFGDSVAEMLASQGIRPAQEQVGLIVRDGGVWGCQVLAPEGPMRTGFGVELTSEKVRPCAADFAAKVAALKPAPRLVLAFFGGLAFEAKIGGTWHHPCDAAYGDAYRRRAEDAIRALGASGRPVAVVLPETPRPGILSKSYGIDDPGERQACLRKPLEEAVAATGAGAVDLRAHVCHGDAACEEHGRAADPRRDGVHYEHEVAVALARWLVPEAERVARPVS
jgi:hypothetical protein